MLLGDLIARLRNEDAAEEILLRLGDLALLADLRQRADAEGLSLGGYAAGAVARFAEGASGEDWVTLMGLMNRAGDPGLVFLKQALAGRTA